jgi:hypothetical protein
MVKSPNGNKIDYIGTVVLRDFRNGVNVAKFDVYFMKNWYDDDEWIFWEGRDEPEMVRIWKGQVANAVDTARKFLNAHKHNLQEHIDQNSRGYMKPLFDCHTIVVFAEAGYFFVDEAGNKSLRCFNIRWHTRSEPKIQNHYSGCGYFSSHGKVMSRTLEWC